MLGIGLSLTKALLLSGGRQPWLQLGTNRNRIGLAETATTSTTTRREWRVRKRTANSTGRNWRIAVPNFWLAGAGAGDTKWSNDWSGYAAIEYNGIVYPATFGGASVFTFTASREDWLISDPIAGLVTPPNAVVWEKGGIFAAAGLKVPHTVMDFNGSAGSINAEITWHNATTFTRQSIAGVLPAAVAANYGDATAAAKPVGGGPGYILLCEYDVRQPAVALIGDSRVQSPSDGLGAGTAQGEDRGALAQGCIDVAGPGTRIVPYLSIGRPGETAAAAATPIKSQYRRLVYPFATHAIHTHGGNDILSNAANQGVADALAAIAQTAQETLWGWSKAAGMKTYHCLLQPLVVDDNVNFGKTPPYAERNSGVVTYGLRKTMSAYAISKVGTSLDGILDLNSAVESGWNANQWSTGTPTNQWITDGITNDYNTDDGVHEGSDGNKRSAVPARAVIGAFVV